MIPLFCSGPHRTHSGPLGGALDPTLRTTVLVGKKRFSCKICFKLNMLFNFARPLLNAAIAPIHPQPLHTFYCVSLYVKHEPAGLDLQIQHGFHRSPELLSGGTNPQNMALYNFAPTLPLLLLGKTICRVMVHGEVIMVCTH